MSPKIVEKASIVSVMDEVEKLQQEVLDHLLAEYAIQGYRYRWRPRGVPDFPCIYNWLAPSPTERHTVATQRDTLLVQANCGVRWTDVQTEMGQLEALGDSFRQVVDPAMAGNSNLGGLPQRAERTGMVTASDRFNDVPVLVLQFTIRAELDRVIT